MTWPNPVLTASRGQNSVRGDPFAAKGNDKIPGKLNPTRVSAAIAVLAIHNEKTTPSPFTSWRPSLPYSSCFLYGPMITIFILSLQGPDGTLTFPVRSFGFYWLGQVFQEAAGRPTFVEPFGRSLVLGAVVMVLTASLSVLAAMGFPPEVQRVNGNFLPHYC